MTAQLNASSSQFGQAVLRHLDGQLESARALLDCVLRQAAAIRARDPEGVLARVAEIQTEMERRGRMEQERAQLLQHAAVQLNVPAHEVDIEQIARLMTPPEGETARTRSAELRGLLAEIAREHLVNRALMRQELSFLEHLTRLLGADEPAGYGAGVVPGAPMAPPAIRSTLSVQA